MSDVAPIAMTKYNAIANNSQLESPSVAKLIAMAL